MRRYLDLLAPPPQMTEQKPQTTEQKPQTTEQATAITKEKVRYTSFKEKVEQYRAAGGKHEGKENHARLKASHIRGSRQRQTTPKT